MKKITAKEIIQEFDLQLLNPDTAELVREITQPSITRNGLELSGAYESSHSEENIIGWGTKERKWFATLKKEDGIKAIRNALSPRTPMVIVSNGVHGESLNWIKEVASDFKIPLVSFPDHLSHAVSTIGPFLAVALSKAEDIHGCLVSIYGRGVMIVGPSGIGKSEAVLELIQDNHLFISDDTVVVTRLGNQFIGRGATITKGYLEARGIGLIDIQHMFGAQIVLDQTDIDLVVELVPGEKLNELDRIGNKHLVYKILGGKIPLIQIPVNQGKSVSALIKAATSAFIAKKHGMNPIEEIKKRGFE